MKTTISILVIFLSISFTTYGQAKNMKKNEKWIWHYPEDLVCIKEIPKAKNILSLKLKLFDPNSDVQLDKKLFLFAIENANTKILDPKCKLDIETLQSYSFAPWYTIWLSTKKGDYNIELYHGGLSFITLPNGNRGAIQFNFSR